MNTLFTKIDLVDFDIIIGADLFASYVALKSSPNKVVWYDAHEYFSQQKWVQEITSSEKIKQIEKYVIQNVKVFTTVSDSLLEQFRIDYKLPKINKFLPNSTNPSRTDEKSIYLRNQLHIPEDSKIILFHGLLVEKYRNIGKLIDLFQDANLPKYFLLFMGYGADHNLRKLIINSNNCFLLDPVGNEDIGNYIRESNLIVMPYPIIDKNTKFGFPNKLGDCVTFKKPFVYNEEMVEIDRWASKFHIGTAFTFYGNDAISSFINAIETAEKLNCDWKRAEREIGWTFFKCTTNEISSNILKG